MSLKVKSISDYSNVHTDITDNTLFFVSNPHSGSWVSKRTDLSSIIFKAEDKISSDIQEMYNLSGMNVDLMNKRIDAIVYSDLSIYGQKTFQKRPMLYSATMTPETSANLTFTTRNDVKDIIEDSDTYISPSSSAYRKNGGSSFDPMNDQATGCTGADKDNFMTWAIPTGGNDSTQYEGADSDGVQCRTTGNLVVYGWLQDSGYVLPQEAWVAIYGKLNGKWTLLQLQPWPVTERSSIIQYVGFNIPVKEGLRLKIKTGFKVESSATGTNVGNTLTFDQVMANTFIGYIVSA